jgi:hypothetical protein
MDRFDAQRAIATLHSFRFYGLVFILPGIVGPGLPAGFATFAAYGGFATGVLAILALLIAKIRPLLWTFVVAFNLAGATDIIVDYHHAIQVGLPAMARQLGATYAIPIIYVPLLMITHVVAIYLLVRPQALATLAALESGLIVSRRRLGWHYPEFFVSPFRILAMSWWEGGQFVSHVLQWNTSAPDFSSASNSSLVNVTVCSWSFGHTISKSTRSLMSLLLVRAIRRGARSISALI